MATFRKRGKSWRAEMMRDGQRYSATFQTKSEAIQWAANFKPKADNGKTLDVLFRRLRDQAGIVGLTFHDSRHEAITRLAGKLEVLELARMVGHKNLNQLLTYYNKTAAELAQKLD